jgi:Family of unknown function (DUF5985)
MKEIVLFIAGVLAMAYAVVSVCFVRFWRQTGDRLFAWFAWAFGILAVQRVAVSFAPTDASYLLRLAAFLLIIIAIADKNRAAR